MSKDYKVKSLTWTTSLPDDNWVTKIHGLHSSIEEFGRNYHNVIPTYLRQHHSVKRISAIEEAKYVLSVVARVSDLDVVGTKTLIAFMHGDIFIPVRTEIYLAYKPQDKDVSRIVFEDLKHLIGKWSSFHLQDILLEYEDIGICPEVFVLRIKHQGLSFYSKELIRGISVFESILEGTEKHGPTAIFNIEDL